MRKEHMKRRMEWLLAAVLLVTLVVSGLIPIQAAGREHHVETFDDLLGLAAQSQTLDFENEIIYLDADIEITPIEQATLDKYNIKHLTFGNSDVWFKGTFDGQGHTIKGLHYQKTILPDPNCGLISYAQNAVIKNLTIEDAVLESIYQGGIVVGQAQNCVLENITVRNSDLEVKPANNIISLITNGGFCGGGIAGLMENSVMYNCEISGTKVHCNITAGVAAVGGEGLYMGGLVGWASNSTIEYCRARSNYAPDGTVRQSAVSNKYDTAVGALGGKSLYAGGIVGGVNDGSRIYDCFSTADVYFYAANYVSVGSGTAGYGGGIAGALRGGSIVDRCHYAGNISSMQYNAVLVIPIIQYDVNICGIARILQGGSQVNRSYFRPSDIESGADISATGSGNTALAGPVTDEDYENVDFWEEQDYDFTGNVDRVTNSHNRQPHPNKWVMDYDLGIPVHGDSVAATFDFPGAGSVTIDKTMLVNQKVTTSDPYSFAVQGIHPREKQQVTLSAKLNNRYRLKGWYRKSDVLNRTTGDINELLEITKDLNAKVPETGTPVTVSTQDNDLFVAGIEAQVTFHQIDGTVLREDWYCYLDALQEAVPNHPTTEGATFYGWTTIPNTAVPGEKGYSAITSTQLNDIMQQDALYVAGDPVRKEMELYPIFVNSLINIQTEFEGHEQDGLDDVTKRDAVGHTVVATDEGGVYIDVTGEEPDGSFPAGYRFKGWYQKIDGTNEVCVSREQKYYVPGLTEKVTYVARFEYAVEYWAKAYHQDNGSSFSSPARFATVWHDYKEGFQDIHGPAYGAENVIGWGETNVDHGKDFTGVCPERYTEENLKITQPVRVYSHNSHTTNAVSNNYSVFTDTDFPGSGEIYSTAGSSNSKSEFEFKPLSDRYKFNFWTLEQQDGHWTYANSKFTTGTTHVNKDYKARAMVYTLLQFHGKDGNILATVNRRYEDPVLLGNDQEFTYMYPHYHLDTKVDSETYDGGKITPTIVSQASPLDIDMTKDGYAFLGWISTVDVKKDSYEWNYIYDVSGDSYCTSDVEKVQPYLVTDDAKVYEAQDLYPVYAKYDIEVTTNIHQMTNLPEDVNKPNLPTYTLTLGESTLGQATITVTAEDGVTPVLRTDAEGAKYHLTAMSCEVDGVTKKLELIPGTNQYSFEGEITAGKQYRFVAYYTPLLITYHCDDNNTIHTVVREPGEKLGTMPEPEYANISNVSGSCFVGWTEQKPAGGYVHKYSGKAELENAKIILVDASHVVKQNMDLYPVFVAPSITVNSNIDTVIKDAGKNPADYRSLQKGDGRGMQLYAVEYPGYKFMGWYTGYVNQENPGVLISKDQQYNLTQPQLFEDQTYTAVFQRALQVTYHHIDGTVLHMENVVSGSRSFVDENGNALDTEPILAMEQKLQANQTFSQWQWNDNGTMRPWKDFCSANITQSMDLYPEICTVTASDSENANYTGKLELTYVESNKLDPTAPAGSYTLTGVFTEEYVQPFLTLTVQNETWNPATSSKTASPIRKLPTRMFVNRGTEEEHKFVEASHGPILTDEMGNARHDFFGKLILKKTFTDSTISDRVFLRVTSGDMTQVIPVDVNAGAGEVTLNLPVGSYTVSEDGSWNWRDAPTISGLDASSRIAVTVGNEHTVTIQNDRVNGKWFTGEHHITNRRQ